MKPYIITLLACIVAIGTAFQLSAQDNFVNQHFSDLGDQDDAIRVRVSGKMFSMTAHLDTDESEPVVREFAQFAQTISAFQAVGLENAPDAKARYKAALRKVPTDFEVLMEVSDKDGEFTCLIQESKGLVSEVILIGHGEGQFGVASVTGEMDLRQLSKFANEISNYSPTTRNTAARIEIGKFKTYPNPTTQDRGFSVEVPPALVEGEAHLIDMSGKIVRTVRVEGDKQTIRTTGLREGTYILELRKNDIRLSQKVVLQ